MELIFHVTGAQNEVCSQIENKSKRVFFVTLYIFNCLIPAVALCL